MAVVYSHRGDVHRALAPAWVLAELEDRVASGAEAARVLRSTGAPGYQAGLSAGLSELGSSEVWQAGKATRSLRPHEEAKAFAGGTAGVNGREL